MWRREMEWLLCVSDHIVQLMPCSQTFPDGTKLQEILDSFQYTEFWYVDQGITTSEDGGSSSGNFFHLRRRNGGCRCLGYLSLGSVRTRDRVCSTDVILRGKSSKQQWP